MKHTVQHTTLCMVVACIFFNSVIGMDDANKDVVSLPSNDTAVISFLLTHKSNLFDHKMICSLSLNRGCEKVLKDSAQKRRECLTEHMQNQWFDCDNKIVWHKYGSACGKKVIMRDEQGKVLCVLYAGYVGCDRILCFDSNNFQKDIPGFERAKFNEEGNFYCYGFGKKMDTRVWGKNQHIVEYCLPQYGRPDARRYGVAVALYNSYALSYFKSFPILLKTFLAATPNSMIQGVKLCSLKDIIIPDNYKECIPCREYTSFDDLPSELVKAINDQYNKQQREKRNNIKGEVVRESHVKKASCICGCTCC